MTLNEQIRSARFIAAVFSSQLNNTPLPERDETLSWSPILNMARTHALLGMVFSAYENVIEREIPSDIYEAYAKEVSILGAKHLVQKAEFEAITQRFMEEKVYFMPLKGFLLKSLYPKPELRAMNDLDIYVFEDSFERAREILISMGYTPTVEAGPVHDGFIKPPYTEIELHKKIALDWKHFALEDSIPSENSEYWRLMKDEDLVIFILKHAAKHDNTGGCGIRTIFDFTLVKSSLFSHLDMAKMKKRIKAEDLWPFYVKMSNLESLWFSGNDVNVEALDFESYTVNGGAYGSRANVTSRKMKDGKFLFFFRSLFPSYSFMKKRFPMLKKCPILLPFLYPLRIIQGVCHGSHIRELKEMREWEQSAKKIKN